MKIGREEEMTDKKLTLEEMLALARKVLFWEQKHSPFVDDYSVPKEYSTGWYQEVKVCFTVESCKIYRLSVSYKGLLLGSFEGHTLDRPELYSLSHDIWNLQESKRQSAGKTQEELEKEAEEQYFQEAKQLAKEAMEK